MIVKMNDCGRYLLCMGLLFLSACAPQGGGQTKEVPSVVSLTPAALVDSAALFSQRSGTFEFFSQDDRRLTARVYRATNFDPVNGPVLFVMHGARRNAERYLQAAAAVVERYNALAIAIEFSRQDYPKGDDYTLGVTTFGPVDETALDEGRWRKPENYLYAEVERLYLAVRQALGGRQSGYYLFGHSAGAQFIHRMMTFMPQSHVLKAVAANAGWYTLPVRGDDPNLFLPYGLEGSPVSEDEVRALLASPLTLLLGTEDTLTADQDPLLRNTPQALQQGATRLARGQAYFSTGRQRAESLDTLFSWHLEKAPGAGHDIDQMIASAGFLLFSPEQEPCTASPAAATTAIVFNEILADPPEGLEGDTNNDGIREAVSDEFIEIVNTGSSPVCLSGWSLEDARKQRHLFPLGASLKGGETLVVFGGGVPTGSFADAVVQVATSNAGLSLSNQGDVISLLDANRMLVKQVSWGDCASSNCAQAHWPGSLDIGESIVRMPDTENEWRLHSAVSASGFSPGVAENP